MAKEFNVVVPHQLSSDEALGRIKDLLADLRNMYSTQVSDVQEDWQGNLCQFSLKMFVFKIAGSIMVGSNTVEVRGKMPLGTGKYEGKVRSMIEQRAKILLAPRPKPSPHPLQGPMNF